MRVFAAIFSLVPLIVVGCPQWRVSAPAGLRPGDLVFRRCDGVWSRWFIEASSREKRFSHVGIVVGESPCEFHGESPLVVHAEADESTGGGCVKVDSWRDFMKDALECAVYRHGESAEQSCEIAKCAMRHIGVPFDASFDLSSTNMLYCTEFVALAMNEALGTNVVGTTVISGRQFIALDDIYRYGSTKIFDSAAQ